MAGAKRAPKVEKATLKIKSKYGVKKLEVWVDPETKFVLLSVDGTEALEFKAEEAEQVADRLDTIRDVVEAVTEFQTEFTAKLKTFSKDKPIKTQAGKFNIGVYDSDTSEMNLTDTDTRYHVGVEIVGDSSFDIEPDSADWLANELRSAATQAGEADEGGDGDADGDGDGSASGDDE